MKVTGLGFGSTFGHTPLAFLFPWLNFQSLDHLYLITKAGATEEVAFPPLFGPAGRFLNSNSLRVHWDTSDFMLERCWCFHQTPSGNNDSALTDGRLREHGHHDLGTRVLIFEWTLSSYLIESSGIQLTRINRMRGSVKLTLFTEELKSRVRVWVKSTGLRFGSTFGHTPLAF